MSAKVLGVTPDCRMGFTHEQIETLMGSRLDEFIYWMRGQTIGLCSGQRYNHETGESEPACDGVAHGPAYYPHDVDRFLRGLPVLD